MVNAAQLPSLFPGTRAAIALDPPVLRPGQTLLATVVGAGRNGTTLLSVGNRLLAANLSATPSHALQPGTQIHVRFEGSGQGARLVALPSASPQAAPAGSGGHSAVGNTAPGAPSLPTRAATGPQLAVAQAAQAAVLRQDSAGTLFAALAGLPRRPVTLPSTGLDAVTRLQTAVLRPGAQPLDGGALKTAILRSGVFFEALLARGDPALMQGDIKSGLLSLRAALAGVAPGKAKSDPRAGKGRPLLPARGAVGRAPAPVPLSPSATTAREDARVLLAQVERVLARITLSQITSLSAAGERASPSQQAEWTLELPVVWGNELSMAQFRIVRDGVAGSRNGERGWTMQFAVNFTHTGEIGAHVSLRTRLVSVMLWAERAETAAALQEKLDTLSGALTARGLTPGRLGVRHGVPEPAQAPPGSVMDDRS